MLRTLPILAWFLVLTSLAYAQTVSVRVSTRSIAQDEELQVTFSFQGEGRGQLPSLDNDWQVVGSQRGSNMQIYNGKVFREQTETLVLLPKRAGQLTIGPAILSANKGVVARSEPVTIVVRGVQALKPTQAGPNGAPAGEQFLLLPELQRDVYYEGEPFVASWVLFVSKQLSNRLRRGRWLSLEPFEPSDAVQREDVLKDEIVEEGNGQVIHGQRYARIPIVREVWKVLRAETIETPSVRATITIPGRGFRRERVRVKSVPLSIEVRPVPQESRPPEYREGTIGSFTIAASIHADAGQSRALLELRVSGTGNLSAIDPPDVSGITGAEIRPLNRAGGPSDQDEITIDSRGVRGTRVFQYLLIPERTGTVFVPAISLAYFDPAEATFKTATSEAITHLAREQDQPAVSTSATSTATPTAQGQSLHPIQSDSQLYTGHQKPLHQRHWYLGLLLGTFALFFLLECLAFWRKRQVSTSGRTRAKRALSTAEQALRTTRKTLNAETSTQAFAEVANTLRAYLASRFDIISTGMTLDQTRSALAAKNVENTLIDRVLQELEQCDFARFTPTGSSVEEAEASLQRASELLKALEETRG